MNKKIKSFVCLLLALSTAFVLLFSVGYADSEFSFFDMTCFGVPAIQGGTCVGTPCLDGKIEAGEYGDRSTRLYYGKGISFQSEGGGEELSDFRLVFNGEQEKLFQDVSVSYNENCLYLAVMLSPDASSLVSPVLHELAGRAYRVSVSLSLASTQSVPERLSNFSNHYFFSPADGSCIAVTGRRIRYGEDGIGRFIGTVSSFSPKSERPYIEGAQIWNGNEYQKHAVLSDKSANERTVFECEIPIGDLLQTLTEEKRTLALQHLKNGTDAFCAGISLEFSVADSYLTTAGKSLCLATGISSGGLCPFSQSGETWNQYLSNTLFAGTSYTLERIPLPLYLVGTAPQVAEDDRENSETESDLNSGGNSAVIPGSPENGGTTPSTPENGGTTPSTPESGNTTPSTPESGNTTPSTPESGNTTPSTPENGGTTPSTPENGGTTPSTPENGGTTPSTPENGGTTPSTPENGGTTPSTPESGNTTPSTPESGNSPGFEGLPETDEFPGLGGSSEEDSSNNGNVSDGDDNEQSGKKEDFPGLPQTDEIISEDYEIIYSEKDSEKGLDDSESKDEKNTELGAILILGAGILLFCSVVGLALFFRITDRERIEREYRERKEREERNQNKKR